MLNPKVFASSRLQEEILQKEEAENNLAAFRALISSVSLGWPNDVDHTPLSSLFLQEIQLQTPDAGDPGPGSRWMSAQTWTAVGLRDIRAQYEGIAKNIVERSGLVQVQERVLDEADEGHGGSRRREAAASRKLSPAGAEIANSGATRWRATSRWVTSGPASTPRWRWTGDRHLQEAEEERVNAAPQDIAEELQKFKKQNKNHTLALPELDR
ncbi:desmin b [Lates japonicus]|uniref:Desmin b n=1 Tax=Lates japonicus TaxID=270547 RepID=A0AAD3NH07_LATJO|nr:desmin b [Lates japonicus]